jgi:hypothetical protein
MENQRNQQGEMVDNEDKQTHKEKTKKSLV